MQVRVKAIGPVGHFKGPDRALEAQQLAQLLGRPTIRGALPSPHELLHDDLHVIPDTVGDRQGQQLDVQPKALGSLQGGHQLDPPPLADLGRAVGAGPQGRTGAHARVERLPVLLVLPDLHRLLGQAALHALACPVIAAQNLAGDRHQGEPLGAGELRRPLTLDDLPRHGVDLLRWKPRPARLGSSFRPITKGATQTQRTRSAFYGCQ